MVSRGWPRVGAWRKVVLVASTVTLLALVAMQLVEASVFARRSADFNVDIRYVELASLKPPPYNVTCTGIYRVDRGVVYYADFETLPGDWVMVNGSLGARGFTGPGGYWGLVEQGYTGRGLRGFPLLWQVREHKTYTAWNPDVRFTPQATNAIRIDSYTAGSSSLGNGYLMLIAPVELINNTEVRNRFNVYFTFSGRTVGYIDIVFRPVDRRDDAYFRAYDDVVPPWQKYGEAYRRLYTVYMPASGTRSFDIVNRTVLPGGIGRYVTFSYVLTDYWIGQSLYFDVFYVLLRTLDGSTIRNFTFPYNAYSVVLERRGTTGDYGYLNFGSPGFTVLHLNMDLRGYTSLWLHTKLNVWGGVGWGGIVLLDSAKRNFYVVALNSTGYLVALRGSGSTWVTLASTRVAGYAGGVWYSLHVNYTRSGAYNYVTAYLYDTGGGLVAQLSFSDSTFTPAYAGLGSYTSNRLYADILYDDFLVSLRDTRAVTIVNTPSQGYVVELYDHLGNPVSMGVSDPTGRVTLHLPVAVVHGGLFKAYYPNYAPCLVAPTQGRVFGGDVYELSWDYIYVDAQAWTVSFRVGYGGNTSYASVATISIHPGYTFYAYLQLDWGGSTIPHDLNLEVYLVNSTTTSTEAIVIKGGLVYRTTTSTLKVSGSDNYIYVVGNYTTPGGYSNLRVYLVVCSTPTGAVCLYTPINLMVRS